MDGTDDGLYSSCHQSFRDYALSCRVQLDVVIDPQGKAYPRKVLVGGTGVLCIGHLTLISLAALIEGRQGMAIVLTDGSFVFIAKLVKN